MINSSKFRTLLNVFAVPSQYNAQDPGGKDWLVGTLAPGQNQNINFDDGRGTCVCDLRAIGTQNSRWTKRDFNVCGETEWDLGD